MMWVWILHNVHDRQGIARFKQMSFWWPILLWLSFIHFICMTMQLSQNNTLELSLARFFLTGINFKIQLFTLNLIPTKVIEIEISWGYNVFHIFLFSIVYLVTYLTKNIYAFTTKPIYCTPTAKPKIENVFCHAYTINN